MEEKLWFNNKRIRIAVVLSLILHAFIIQMKLSNDSSSSTVVKNDYVEVTMEDMEQLRNAMNATKAKAANVAKRQIVNNELTGKEVKPVDSRFLGEKDQTYDRQTLAEKVDIFNKAALGVRTGDIAGDKNEEVVKKVAAKTQAVTKVAPETVATGNNKKVSLNDLSMNPESLQEAMKKADTLSSSNSASKLGVKAGDAASRGLSSNNDFIETVPLGDFTHLNTTEFKYYGFYHRIRQKLEQFWGNSIREKAKSMYATGRRLPATENLITSITVDINEQGEIVHVKVVGTSGVRELDDAAVESFNKAGPFPNPPQGMIKNGLATIEWGFVVKG
ncbi:MAG: TonB family protein [Bacteriovoracaceae bacterium]